MQSWKQKKYRDERRKTRRKARKCSISHATAGYMSNILQTKEKILKADRFLEKMRLAIRRTVFK
jgi:hypothetical protein